MITAVNMVHILYGRHQYGIAEGQTDVTYKIYI